MTKKHTKAITVIAVLGGVSVAICTGKICLDIERYYLEQLCKPSGAGSIEKALRFFGRVKARDAIPKIIDTIHRETLSGRREVVEKAFECLETIGEASVPFLKEELFNPHIPLAIRAARALGKIGAKSPSAKVALSEYYSSVKQRPVSKGSLSVYRVVEGILEDLNTDKPSRRH